MVVYSIWGCSAAGQNVLNLAKAKYKKITNVYMKSSNQLQ